MIQVESIQHLMWEADQWSSNSKCLTERNTEYRWGNSRMGQKKKKIMHLRSL